MTSMCCFGCSKAMIKNTPGIWRHDSYAVCLATLHQSAASQQGLPRTKIHICLRGPKDHINTRILQTMGSSNSRHTGPQSYSYNVGSLRLRGPQGAYVCCCIHTGSRLRQVRMSIYTCSWLPKHAHRSAHQGVTATDA